MCCTLDMTHVENLPFALCNTDVVPSAADVSHTFLNGIISINERDSFRSQLLLEQQSCKSVWFTDIGRSANNGTALYQFKNGLLCKLFGDHFCHVIPDPKSSTVQVILSDLHASGLGGHVGRKKLLAMVKQRFYWQNMYGSVDSFVRKWSVCSQNKTSTVKPQGKFQPLENPDCCFDHISMDFVVSLITSSRVFDGIMMMVDRFSHLVKFIPMKTASSATDVARLFFDNWLCVYGAPSKIISDRDVPF